MTTYSFANLDAWAKKTTERMDSVVKASAQDVVEAAQRTVAKGGNMPVDTGFLRNSLQSSLSGSTSLNPAGEDSYVLVAAQMEAGDVATFTWTANYARHVEYGARGRPGRFFVRNAVSQWAEIVAGNVAKAKAAVG